jgi:mannose-1-phosphate guanylyltransferase/mannose/cellobiose epimerase-like protein (N-acyl-D-glucosamine 2-epimerase family)
VGSHSIFQETASRVASIEEFTQLIVVANHRHADLIEAQLAAIGVTAHLILEPVGRDSGPAIAAAATWIAKSDPAGVAVVVAADHHLPDAESFRAAVTVAAAEARKGRIVTFGVTPREASTAYGYIRPALGDGPVLPVAAFVEKPCPADALAYVDAGYLWNSGNFVAQAESLLTAFETHIPELARIVGEAVATARIEPTRVALSDIFRTAPKISFDYAVMEKTAHAAVLPVSFDWSDLGAWSAVLAVSKKDEAGNAVLGDAIMINTQDCLIRTDGPQVATIGVRDLAVVVENGAVLVCDLAHDQHIKAVHSEAQARHLKKAADKIGIPTLPQTRQRLTAWLMNQALPTWWCFGADHVLGGFHDRLTWAFAPAPYPRRIRVQARQVFAYAKAGLMGWPGPWRAAVDHGLAWLETRHRRTDGLYRTLVDQDGSPRDDSAHLYDQAFVLLAMATAAKALPDRRAALSSEGRALLARISEVFSLSQGGFRASETGRAVEADPIMHLFEATQAWLEVDPGGLWEDLARNIATQFLDKMMDQDRPQIREEFEADWAPKAGPAGYVIEPGHQFEWAWLLGRWARRAGDARAMAAAEGLYKTGLTGIDLATGVVLDELTVGGAPTGPMARLWPQAERLRAVLMFETHPEATRAAAHAGAVALESYFTKDPPGLWRDCRADLHMSEDAAMASSFYHIIGAIAALHEHHQV